MTTTNLIRARPPLDPTHGTGIPTNVTTTPRITIVTRTTTAPRTRALPDRDLDLRGEANTEGAEEEEEEKGGGVVLEAVIDRIRADVPVAVTVVLEAIIMIEMHLRIVTAVDRLLLLTEDCRREM